MPAAPSLVLGTRNRKKKQELADLLAGLRLELKSLDQFPDAPEVIEDGATFADNARKKASELAAALETWVLGEDSGLAVDALDGRPGVFSARYAGAESSDAENNRKLLEELAAVPLPKRTAQYVCYAAVADPSGRIRAEAEGRVNGLITTELRGGQGFGYDPLFLIREYHKTFGELGLTVKHCLSHRARAVAALGPQLAKLLAAGELV